MPNPNTPTGGERGAALVTALFALVLLMLLGLSITSLGMMALGTATNDRDTRGALDIADAGIAHARAILIGSNVQNFTPVLRGGDGVGCTGDELAAAPSPAPASYPTQENLIPQAGRSLGPGLYRVRVCDDHTVESAAVPANTDANVDANQRVLVRSTGLGANGASVEIETLLSFAALPGMLVNGNLRLNGDLRLQGQYGTVHANGSVEVSGNPCTSQAFSATSRIVVGGSANDCEGGRGTLAPQSPNIPVPLIDPASFRSQATYQLGNDGYVRNSAGTIVGNARNGNWNGWDWDSGGRRWVANDSIPAGTYFSEGNIEVSGNPGSSTPSSPRALTFIAVGWVNISGNPVMRPSLAGPPAYAIVAGTDMGIGGNPSTPYQGVFYARDQIKFNGNPAISGQVIAANQGDLAYPTGGTNLVPRLSGGFMELSGNPIITANAGSGLGSFQMTRWRECRGANSALPCGAP